MLVAELTERRTFALPEQFTAADGLKMLTQHRSTLLPVVHADDQVWIGNVYRHELLPQKGTATVLSELAHRDEAFIGYASHIFDAARLMLRHKTDILPVLGDHFHYEGFVTRDAIYDSIVRLLNVEETGRILFVEMEQQDFTLAQIVRFIEEENGRIMGMTVDSPNVQRNTFRISIKINLMEAGRILASLQRHGYTVSMPDGEEWLEAEFGQRADELMHFLEL